MNRSYVNNVKVAEWSGGRGRSEVSDAQSQPEKVRFSEFETKRVRNLTSGFSAKMSLTGRGASVDC